MLIKIIEDESGQYINPEGKKVNVLACSWVKGEKASEFVEFKSFKQALKFYNLTKVNAPVVEEEVVISNEENTTEKPFELPNEG